ncbi:hypothetical protein [Pseudomonas sp. SHLB3]|uniref:hypothetical protein n=2 Tax=Pseudomonas TaxID=286 RepID=UPI00235F1789|nr:hypothetical protein [Pseudomonas sp. SHLB3]
MMNAQIETLGEMASTTLQASVAYELESAIASTVALVKESEGHLAERLSRHLDDLLAEQLRQVTADKPVELQPVEA